jgi:protease-4
MDNEAQTPAIPPTPPPLPPPAADSPRPEIPPPLKPPPPSEPPKRRHRWLVAVVVALVALGVIFFAGLLPLAHSFVGIGGPMHGGHAGPRLVEAVVEDNDARDKILLLRIEGIIFGNGDGSMPSLPEYVKACLKRAGEDDRIKAVLLKIDSPGGEVLASDDIYREIDKFQKETGKPVVAYLGALAASGGYYVASACRWITANELTITGSIGVIMHGYNYRGLMNKVGVRPEVFKSGKFKDMLGGEKDLEKMTPAERELYEQERAMVQAMVDEAFERFKTVVKQGREEASRRNRAEGRRLSPNWVEYADGRILTGRRAYELGFVDEVGVFEEAVDRAKSLAAVSNANLVEYQVPFDLLNVLRFFGKTEAPAIKLDLGVAPPKLRSGRLYFLPPALPL